MHFIVWKDGGSSPTVKHETRELATAEAARLAKLHPGSTFGVYAFERCAFVEVPKPPPPPPVRIMESGYTAKRDGLDAFLASLAPRAF